MPQDVFSVKESTGERVNPSTENLQRELIVEFGRNSNRSTDDVKFQALTLAASSVVGTPEIAHGCNGVEVMTVLSDCYIGDADGQPVLLIQNIWLPLPINNVGNLRFKSATGGVVYMISANQNWRLRK